MRNYLLGTAYSRFLLGPTTPVRRAVERGLHAGQDRTGESTPTCGTCVPRGPLLLRGRLWAQISQPHKGVARGEERLVGLKGEVIIVRRLPRVAFPFAEHTQRTVGFWARPITQERGLE